MTKTTTTLHVTLSCDVDAEVIGEIAESTGVAVDDVAAVVLALLQARYVQVDNLRAEVDRLRAQLDEKEKEKNDHRE